MIGRHPPQGSRHARKQEEQNDRERNGLREHLDRPGEWGSPASVDAA
jgi:hypothetical protein